MSNNKAEATYHPHQPPKELMSNLIDHANRELDFLGYPPERKTIEGEQFDPENSMRKNILDLVSLFAAQGHSGFSARYCAETAYKLMKFEPLAPITNDVDEWQDQSDVSGYAMWQNRRHGEAFSIDGGLTYYLLEDKRQWGWAIWKRLPASIRKMIPEKAYRHLVFHIHTAPTRPHHLEQIDPQV